MVKPGNVEVNLTGPAFSGTFVAPMWKVASKLTDRTRRQMVADICGMWPEMTRTVDERKELRRLPSFALALILVQE